MTAVTVPGKQKYVVSELQNYVSARSVKEFQTPTRLAVFGRWRFVI